MQYSSLQDFLKKGVPELVKGPLALILIEDTAAATETIKHHLDAGFPNVAVFANDALPIPSALEARIQRVTWDMAEEAPTTTIVNAVIEACPGRWLYYCYNAEFLFFPFCEQRSIGEMIAFNVEERRDTVLTYVIDLYAGDLRKFPNAVDLDGALMDKSGYYALNRTDRWNNALDRQMDFYGGLRWRFEEHIPTKKRRIDRVALFKAKPDLTLSEEHIFSDPEYNTYACPWHHNITATICSFRTAKALKRNPGSTYDIKSFRWHNSVPFEWGSQQLMDLGLMEPGQWF